MGMNLIYMNGSFAIPSDKVAMATLALRDFMGGQHGVDTATLRDLFNFQGWDLDVQDDGRHVLTCNDSNSLGDNAEFFNAVAPYVESGSFIDTLIEYEYPTRWYFDGKTMTEIGLVLVPDDGRGPCGDDCPMWQAK